VLHQFPQPKRVPRGDHRPVGRQRPPRQPGFAGQPVASAPAVSAAPRRNRASVVESRTVRACAEIAATSRAPGNLACNASILARLADCATANPQRKCAREAHLDGSRPGWPP
jgi:hypothetical protein